MAVVQSVFVIISLIVTFSFFIYGLNTYYLLAVRRRYRSPALAGAAVGGTQAQLPRIAIHLPIYNEKYVVRRLINACADAAAAYGPDRVRIIVMDDSTDDTLQEIEAAAAEQRARGITLDVIHRPTRHGYKAGALQHALELTAEDYIAVFDADFIPPADFLTRTVPLLQHDTRLGIVQSRWAHVNEGYSPLTRAISLGIDMHFYIEQPARFAAGCFLSFNGSGGLIRREALLKAGGWQSDTLAEDLDASYRIQLAEYRVAYLRDLPCPGEVPLTVPSYKTQQGRWACGSLRAARKLLPRIIPDSRLCIRTRIQAFIHLTYYMVHPLMFVSFLLSTVSVLLGYDGLVSVFPAMRAASGTITVPLLLLLWAAAAACTASFWVGPLVTVRERGRSILHELPTVLLLAVIGFGISLSNSIQAAKALFSNRIFSFKRTPKYNVDAGGGGWRGRKYQIPRDLCGAAEAVMALLGIAAAASAASRGIYWPLLLILPYSAGYGVVSLLSFLQSGRREAARS